MQCAACNEVNPEANRFCQGCGASFIIVCPVCEHLCVGGAAFCGSCGTALSSSRNTGSRYSSTFVRRSPVHWAELKQVTVLFADLVSSTELVARLDAEEAMSRLKPALATMCNAVARFKGSVVRTLGDGIMALFGAPCAQEGHAFMASQAALAIRGTFRPRDDGLSIRAGLHSGEVVTDGPVTHVTMEPSAYGITVHLASRLPAFAEPGGICITDETYQLVRTFCDADPLGRHPLRGVPKPVELFILKGLRPAVASQQFAESR